MKTQQQIKEWITKDMQELGYKLVPPFDFEVLDTEGWELEKRNAYYQNLTKRAIEIEFQKEIDKLKL